MVTGSDDVDEIYHRMAAIRRERHKHVSESVAGAEAVIDWGRYTWMYPWIALGAAAAVGYLVYTGRRPTVRAGDPHPADGAIAAAPVTGASAQRSGSLEARPEYSARHMGFLVARGRPCGPELRAALP